MSSSSTPSTKVCFNFHCKEALELPRQGWRRRTGEFADLCDRCSSAYDEGKFCETFHLNSSGWRSCESCGQKIHCGCIVSFHTFVLLDAGGIECLTCARKSYILTPNPAWPPPSHFLPLQPEQIKDVKNWTPIAGSGPIPWRQAPGLFNGFTDQRLCVSERPSASSSDNKRKEEPFERVMNGKLKISLAGRLENGYAGLNCDELPKSSLNAPEQPSFAKNNISASGFCPTTGSACKNEPNDHSKVCTTLMQPTTLLNHVGNQSGGHAAVGSAGESQMNNKKTRSDGRRKHHLLPRYWPRITDQELQQISGDSNSVITPLFEKVLTASDAGRIGRLVLPKKCAEAYFPPISHPEGLPLKVQDLKGKEWVFQFRFWPNNNSRMYVLEGVTPCIQSMQLHAGDIVIFSRIEPEGKLVMGCRKASTILTADQGNEACNNGKGNVSTKSFRSGFSSTHAAAVDSTSLLPESKKSDDIVKTLIGNRSVRCKRKSSSLGSKSKHMRIDSDVLVELKLTVVQAQGLMRPPPCGVPRVIVIEGCEFEEFEQDAPIIGRPTVPSISHLGEKMQWVQCEDCFKWRKIPLDAILPSRWTCSENMWDPERIGQD